MNLSNPNILNISVPVHGVPVHRLISKHFIPYYEKELAILSRKDRKTLEELYPDHVGFIKNVASNIDKAIKSKGYSSTTKFCYDTGISRTLVQDIISNRVSPSLVTLLRISEVLEIDVIKLLKVKRKK